MRFLLCTAIIAAALSSAALADEAPAMKPSLIRGTVQSFDGKTLAIKTAAGAVVTLPVTGSTHFATVMKRGFSQLRPNAFIGATTVPGKDGNLHAEEIHTIPLHGLNEGQYAWDHHPSSVTGSTTPSTMTAGTIAAVRDASPNSGPQLTVIYHAAAMVDGKCQGLLPPGQQGCKGVAVIDVTPDTVIEAIVPAFRPDVKPGLAVNAGILTDAAGHQFLNSAVFESEGVKPEF